MRHSNFTQPGFQAAAITRRKTASKRMAALMAATLIATTAAFAPRASAASIPESVNITVEGTGSEYAAYKLMDLTMSAKPGAAGSVSTDYNYAYTVNEKYMTAFKAVFPDVHDANGNGTLNDEYVDMVASMEPDAVREFADKMYAAVKSGTSDATASDKVFSGLKQGYYLIVETTTAGESDSVSLVMLDTAGHQDIHVTAKEGAPTLTKKIVLADGSKADADFVRFGETVRFELSATMPQNIDGYEKYKLVFHDDLPEGFSAKNIAVKVGDTAVTEMAGVTVATSGATDSCDLEVAIADVKGLEGVTVGKDTAVTVTYDCDVPATATVGSTGNVNTAKLEFSSDPYTEAATGKTPEDINKVFTTGITIDKKDNNKDPLAGANFKLEKKAGENDWTEVAMSGTVDETTTSFTFNGLDEGDYRITEIQTPNGYMKIDPIEFTVSAKVDLDSADPQLSELKVMNGGTDLTLGDDAAFAVTENKTVTTTVINTAGNEMPGTGGEGTYLIYGGGAVLLLAAAGCVIVAKKKNKA